MAVTTRPGSDRRVRHLVRRPRCRAARRRLREGARLHPSRRRRNGNGSPESGPSQDDRHLLYAAVDDRVSRPPHARAAGPRPDRRRRFWKLRVLDPAMGSGAFLVAACRYLSEAYEAALIAEGAITRSDISAADRAAFRRIVAQRCPLRRGPQSDCRAAGTAVALGCARSRADRPPHLLRSSPAAPATVWPGRASRTSPVSPPARSSRDRASALPLFANGDILASSMASVVAPPPRESSGRPTTTAAVVRSKERTIESLNAADGPLGAWRLLADAWCAGLVSGRTASRRWTAEKLAGVQRIFSAETMMGCRQETGGRWRTTVLDAAVRETVSSIGRSSFPRSSSTRRARPGKTAGFDARDRQPAVGKRPMR